MPWWWSRRESGSPYTGADAVYDESIRLSLARDFEASLEKAQAAAAAYRLLIPKTRGIDAQRRLAKALWREAMLFALLHRLAEARVPARECMELGTQLLARLDGKRAAMDGVVLEAATALNDFNQLAIFGAPHETSDMIDRAIEIARRSSGIGSRQALATSLHNRASNYWGAWSARRATASEVQHALALTREAIQLREILCAEAQPAPHNYWELANSRTQLGKLLEARGTPQDAIAELTRALNSIASLSGATVDGLRADIVATLERARRSMASAFESGDPQRVAQAELANSRLGESPIEQFQRLVLSNPEAADMLAEHHAGAMIESRRGPEALEIIEAVRRSGDKVAWPPARAALWAERHLRLLLSMGRNERVLTLLAGALEAADEAIMVADDASGAILREKILFHGVGAAKALGEWPRAHQLGNRISESLEDRNAHRGERLQYRWSDYAALFELGRVDDAEALLRECLEEADSLGDQCIRGLIFCALGLIAGRRGDSIRALELKRSGLQSLYATTGLECEKADAHEAYGNELARTKLLSEAGAHWSLAALVRTALHKNVAPLVQKLSLLADYCEPVPGSIEELLVTVDRTAGVRANLLLTDAMVTPEMLESLRIQLSSAQPPR
jgi:tetratricopeptide (TPR) repeat protein